MPSRSVSNVVAPSVGHRTHNTTCGIKPGEGNQMLLNSLSVIATLDDELHIFFTVTN